MKSTPERIEALRTATSLICDTPLRNILWGMAAECEQELPKPLVLRTHSTERNYFAAYFTRDLEPEDIVAILAALTKAFPAKE